MAVQSNLTCTDSGLFKACDKIPFCFTEAGYHCLLLSFLQNFSIKVWDNCGVRHRVAFEHFPCSGLAVGNFYVGSGDVLPPLEMHFCHSIFTAGHSDPRSSCFPSASKWHRKKEGRLASAYLFSPAELAVYHLSVADGCCRLFGAGMSSLHHNAIWCGLSCPFAPSDYFGFSGLSTRNPWAHVWDWHVRSAPGLCFSPALNDKLARNKAHWKMQIFCRLWKLTPLINLHI